MARTLMVHTTGARGDGTALWGRGIWAGNILTHKKVPVALLVTTLFTISQGIFWICMSSQREWDGLGIPRTL